MPNEHKQDEAQASDVEQQTGHGDNLRDSGPGAERPTPDLSKAIGSSGHTPGREELLLPEGDMTGSPGADADRGAAQP